MNEKLKNTLAEVFNLSPTEIHEGLMKENIGSWDSLKQMDLVVTLEREYTTTLEITDIIKMTSVASIINVLRDKGFDLGG
ncbi:acyl carrier protein [Eionea flava]